MALIANAFPVSAMRNKSPAGVSRRKVLQMLVSLLVLLLHPSLVPPPWGSKLVEDGVHHVLLEGPLFR